MTGKRILVDTSKCQACKACQVACKQWHSLGAEDTTFTGSYQNPPDMSGANLTVVKFTEAEVGGKLKFLFFKDMCRHCKNTPCVGACRLGAIVKKPNGAVIVKEGKCDPVNCTAGGGQRSCEAICPYNVPKLNYVKDGGTVITKMRKCDFCYDRFADTSLPLASRKPACMVTCPPGAIMVKAADTVLNKANKRVTYLKANGYPNANVYPPQTGTPPYGPTRVLWVLTDDPSVYGLPMAP